VFALQHQVIWAHVCVGQQAKIRLIDLDLHEVLVVGILDQFLF
jgi:hypothetical protein